MIVFGNCNFFTVLSIRLKTCRANGFFFFTRQNVRIQKIWRVSEVLRARLASNRHRVRNMSRPDCDFIFSHILKGNNLDSHDCVENSMMEMCQCYCKVDYLVYYIIFYVNHTLFQLPVVLCKPLFLGTFFLKIFEMLLHFRIYFFSLLYN